MILNYTTKVPASRSVGEISGILAKHGADTIGTQYEQGEPVAVGFRINTAHGPRSYQLPANVAGVERALILSKAPRQYLGRAQAQRVAWRIVKDWIEAQIAVVEAGLTTFDTVMLPYMVTASGRTLAAAYHESPGTRAAIEAGGPRG